MSSLVNQSASCCLAAACRESSPLASKCFLRRRREVSFPLSLLRASFHAFALEKKTRVFVPARQALCELQPPPCSSVCLAGLCSDRFSPLSLFPSPVLVERQTFCNLRLKLTLQFWFRQSFYCTWMRQAGSQSKRIARSRFIIHLNTSPKFTDQICSEPRSVPKNTTLGKWCTWKIEKKLRWLEPKRKWKEKSCQRFWIKVFASTVRCVKSVRMKGRTSWRWNLI